MFRKKNIKKAFYPWLAASLICMAAIFMFSAQNADDSSRMSGAITSGVFGAVLRWFGVTETTAFLETLEVFVRKTAHVFVFSLLGFCAFNAIGQLTENTRNVFWISLCFCSFYAATDEFHQIFVPGRACMWQDWLIDTAGVLLGVGAAIVLRLLISSVRKRKAKKVMP